MIFNIMQGKTLKFSLRSGLSLCKCLTETDKQTAYEVIRLNRESKGYPLRMTYSQVAETIKILDHDFFVVKVGEVPIASAIVFCITEQIYQVIYWGDVPGYSQYKPINYLSYKLIEYYKQKNIRYLDIGPSSESGIPNFGLCDFKQSIGCETQNTRLCNSIAWRTPVATLFLAMKGCNALSKLEGPTNFGMMRPAIECA